MIKKVLIANRGEIAVRIVRTLRDAGYSSVAVYSEADEASLHVKLADEAICIGPASSRESYLSIDNIIAAARRVNADAIHPGYGFLSENADFAHACAHAGIVFIGPPPEAIRLMGNKREAKEQMIKAGVPCIPGYQGQDQSNVTLLAKAKAIGSPLMVKAAAGGGGRGMRLVKDLANLESEIESARIEAKNAFGSDELILERAVVNGRHVEIQVAADTLGNVIFLGERDCSIQRRHQKVIEEAPSPAVDDRMRSRMGEAAVLAAKACGYCGVGTVEFLLDDDGAFYFLEMNTRLQVEHPVTEFVTGVDLVDWQLMIANGEPLPWSQDDVRLSGHAMEARVYAEDPANGFLPQTGKIRLWNVAAGVGVRVDHCVENNTIVSPHYDPMLAKIIAYGRNREEARRRLRRAIDQSSLLGLTTNRSFLIQILDHPTFISGEATTSFIDERILDQAKSEAKVKSADLCLAAALFCVNPLADSSSENGVWGQMSVVKQNVRLLADQSEYEVEIRHRGDQLMLSLRGGDAHTLEALKVRQNRVSYAIDAVRKSSWFFVEDDTLFLESGARSLTITNITYRATEARTGPASGQLVAPIDGLLVKVERAVGDCVRKGEAILIVEAMKMQHRIATDVAGTLSRLHCASGAQVKKGQLLAEITLDQVEEEKQ